MDNKVIIFNLIEKTFEHTQFKFISNDEKELTKMILENGLIGLVYETIDQSSFQNIDYLDLLTKAWKVFIYKDVQQESIINEVHEILEENKINHIFLKGTRLKKIYPKSYMRGMGDIDLLVKEDDFEKGKQLLEKLKYKFMSAVSHHHVYETPDGNSVELHRRLFSLNDHENTNFLSQSWDNSVNITKYNYRFSVEYEYIYLLTHLIRHVRTSGIGIRSVLDMYVFEEHYKDVINYELLNEFLEKYNLSTFDTKIKRLNTIFTNKLKPTDEDLKAINYLMISGIHGKGSKHERYTAQRTFEKENHQKSKLSFFLSQAFPPKRAIEEKYTYLKKCSLLLPVAWVSRGVRQLFKFKDTKKRLKSVISDQNVDTVKSVYDYFGI